MIAALNWPAAARRALITGVMAGALGWSMPGSAAIVETSTMENFIEWDLRGRYGGFDNQFGSTYAGAGDYSHSFVGRSPTQVAALSYDVTTRLDSNGNFFFLHNAMCIGSCVLSIDTTVKFTLFNNSPDIVNFRFDSQITPGHLARQNFGSGAVEANFNFTLIDGAAIRPFAFQMDGEAAVNQFRYPTTDPTFRVVNGNPGFTTLNGLRAQNSGGAEVFNGGTPPNWNVLDWGATNIGINLKPLFPYETRNFFYSLSTFIRMENPCTEFATCAGLQVAFGDPRNDGSVSQLSARLGGLSFGKASPLAGVPAGYSPVVGAEYDPFQTRVDFNPQSTPDTRQDPVVPPITYNSIFVPSAGGIPEPASWLMLITGFGMAGVMLRRQRRAVA